MTKIPVPTERDFEKMVSDWNVFVALTVESPLLFTTKQWREILGANITSRTMHLERVAQIIDARPYIGITDAGLVAIYLGTKKSLVETASGVNWITGITLGTYENADNPEIEGVTVSRMGTNKTLATPELKTFQQFFSLTTDDLRNVNMLSYEHTWMTTEAYYLYSCGTMTVTPIPENVEGIKDFRFIMGEQPNTVEAIDEHDRSHLGVLQLVGIENPDIKVFYEAITNPGTPTTLGANRTRI